MKGPDPSLEFLAALKTILPPHAWELPICGGFAKAMPHGRFVTPEFLVGWVTGLWSAGLISHAEWKALTKFLQKPATSGGHEPCANLH